MSRFLRSSVMAAAALMVTTAAAQADEFAFKLKVGAGSDVVQSQCAACHSLDYIGMNAPFPSAKVWDAEVTKMIKVFGATISPDEAAAAIAYLSKNYGS